MKHGPLPKARRKLEREATERAVIVSRYLECNAYKPDPQRKVSLTWSSGAAEGRRLQRKVRQRRDREEETV